MEDLSYEQQAHDAGYALVCGVDEAGAGPLMGPVYAAAVILPEKFELPGLNDSKKLTEKKREALFLRIQQQALTWSVASVSAGEIDETDILSARMKAMQLAVDGLAPRPDFALIDGNRDHGKFAAVTTPHRCIVGGDAHAASIAAASILAKVSRDRYVIDVLDKQRSAQEKIPLFSVQIPVFCLNVSDTLSLLILYLICICSVSGLYLM